MAAVGMVTGPEAVEEAASKRHRRLVLEDRVQRLNRRLLGPRKDPETGAWSKKHRAGTCGLPLSDRVRMGYVVRPEGADTSEVHGVVACAAANLCLRCGLKIASARAAQIERLAAAMKALGYHAYLVTTTFAHSRGDGLAETFGAMMDGWKALRESHLWRGLTAGGGGFVRVVETTWSARNGYHPHVHALVFSKLDLADDREFGPSELERMEHALWGEWSAQMAKAGRVVSEQHGLTMLRADDPAMGRYLSKVGLEMTMAPVKTGRSGSMSLWEVAVAATEADDEKLRAQYQAVWAEYVEVVGGRRLFAMSHGLLKRAGVDEIDEQEEAERQVGEFHGYVDCESPVYVAADRAGLVPEVKGLLSSRIRPEVLARVLSRRLGRQVGVSWPPGGLPVLCWAELGEAERAGGRLLLDRPQDAIRRRVLRTGPPTTIKRIIDRGAGTVMVTERQDYERGEG